MNLKWNVQVYYQFILKICSVTYIEIFHASSVQLYLTFKAFFKKSVVYNFFKSLRGLFPFILISTLQNFFKFAQEVKNIAYF